jgi:hypothetical protein
VTAEWLTAVLEPMSGGRVVDVVQSAVGTGQIADSIRLDLVWEPAAAGPASLVAKVTSASEASRQAALATRTYEVEVGFYSDLADKLPVRSPRCYWAGFDHATAAYCVLLEDLAPAVQGDQMRGCSVEEAGLAIDELALLHAPMWGAPGLDELSWMQGRGGTSTPGTGSFVEMLMPGFLERFGARLSPDVADLVPRFVARLSTQPPATAPLTIVHGDFRSDNLMFGLERVCVLDWQTVSVGRGVSDVSYFLGGSLLPDDRRAAERDLLERYCKGLSAQGVELDEDECWLDYRRYACSSLVMAIIASMLVTQTDRGDEMFLAMADRSGRLALDLDTEALLS